MDKIDERVFKLMSDNEFTDEFFDLYDSAHELNEDPSYQKKLDWSTVDALLGYGHMTEEITAIVDSIVKFEKGDRSKRHANPGALAVKKGNWALDNKLERIFGEYLTNQGDEFQSNGEAYVTLDFNNQIDGLMALRNVVGNILNQSGGDIHEFVSTYTGLPKDSDTVINYANDINNKISYEQGR
jgi:hypothetical protein